MGAQQIRPKTLEERLVYWTIVTTWIQWLAGALYFTGPVVGYLLLMIYAGRFFGFLNDKPKRRTWIPIGVVLWMVGMAVMALALLIGHLDFELGLAQTIKSLVGWAKGWALLAIFPLAGAVLMIRAHLIYRAIGILALQTLVVAPLLMSAGFAGLPMDLYVSPLSILGGASSEFFDVTLYAIDDTDGSLRWRFFAPWATAAAFAASMGMLLALYERSNFWKVIGIVSAVVVCWMAGSRSSIVGIPFVVGAVMVIANFHRPRVLVAVAFALAALVLSMDVVLSMVDDWREAFNAAREASSRVRATLNNIGFHRWLSEAFWFGHGVVERGPHLVEFMPIGSHHTWYGLLYVKGLAGFLALAVPLGFSIFELSVKAQCDRVARCALCVVLAVAIFSMADNLEIVTYLVWPGLLMIGIGLRRRLCNPYVEWMRPAEGRSRQHQQPIGERPLSGLPA